MESPWALIMKKKGNTKTARKRTNPNYITVNGDVYEKLSDSSVEVEFDLQEDVYDQLTRLVKDGKYVSIGDAVRHILRMKLESLESQTK